jgi:aquaporin Z
MPVVREQGRRAPGGRGTGLDAWPLWLSELLGTALLVGLGCSLVIVDFGVSSPLAALLPDPALRRALTGFLFGSVGALIAISRVGVISGAHINPAVTLAFWLEGRMQSPVAIGYVLAQLLGGLIGALPLRLWGAMGASVAFGATRPGPAGPWIALLGEAGATFCLIAGLLFFLGRPRLRNYTPALFPVLYGLLVWLEAPLSGTSTNPARSLGPGLVAGDLAGAWIYWLGPLAGVLLALGVRRSLPAARSLEIRVAKVFHFQHDHYGIFTEKSAPSHRPASGQ